MRYTEAFLGTLPAPIAAILRVGPQRAGEIPFVVRPSASGAYDERGMALDAGGATPASTATVSPDPAGAEPVQYMHTLITSGDGASETAGRFGIPSLSMLLTSAAGYVWRAIVALDITTAGRGGMLQAVAFAVDFEPDGTEDGDGWTKGSGDARVLRWYNGTPGSTVALTGSAPTDGRRYDAIIACAAGSTTAYAVLIDLSDPDAPVIADSRTFTPSGAAGVVKGLELNASPGPAASGQTAVTLRFYLLEGCLLLRELPA